MSDILKNLHVYNAVLDYAQSDPVIFHMPGHKAGSGIPEELRKFLLKFDVTEIPEMDNLYKPEGILKKAMKACADYFDVKRTLFSVNGSTACIHAALQTVIEDRGGLIMARDCHKSVYNKVIMSNYTPYYIPVEFDGKMRMPSVPDSDKVGEIMDETAVRTVIITHPNYYGMCCDVTSIAETVHNKGGILIVDEAHGAHFKFSDSLPGSAIDCGADIVIQSAHKTLPVINQGAYLHVCSDRVDIEKLNYTLSMIQTSSPSYIIMCLLEFAATYLHEYGNILYNELNRKINTLCETLQESSDIRIKTGLCKNAIEKDGTRIIIDACKAGFTGFELEKYLKQSYNINIEAADLFNVLLIATISDPNNYYHCLYKALKGNAKFGFDNSYAGFDPKCDLPERQMLPCEAVKRNKMTVPLDKAIGYVVIKSVIPYPPGVPLIVPGEIVTERVLNEIRAVIKCGGFIEGLTDKLYMEVVK